jgi:predicted ArsR family transcriptional regulator
MEQEYRRARAVVGRLDPKQLADCYLRLKAAIDGDFYPIEVGEDRVVLGNRTCPFGNEVVRRAPSLCQMTSSVFGGIAARNTGHAVVQLDERIAVGDPECRVTVLLGARSATDAPGGFHYHGDATTGDRHDGDATAGDRHGGDAPAGGRVESGRRG